MAYSVSVPWTFGEQRFDSRWVAAWSEAYELARQAGGATITEDWPQPGMPKVVRVNADGSLEVLERASLAGRSS